MRTINILETAADSDRTTVTAGHSLDHTHICPVCKSNMQRGTVGRRSSPVPAWICVNDRIALPVKDGE